jgi:hypothetical protein
LKKKARRTGQLQATAKWPVGGEIDEKIQPLFYGDRMEYARALKLLVDSEAEDWKKTVTQFGREVSVFRGDVNLRLETSSDDEHIQNDNFVGSWANSNPDPSAKGYFYDLYYNASMLHRFVLVSVDGARASLPLPRSLTTSVPLATYRVAEIFDSGQLQDYLRSSGLTVERSITCRRLHKLRPLPLRQATDQRPMQRQARWQNALQGRVRKPDWRDGLENAPGNGIGCDACQSNGRMPTRRPN